MLFAAADAKPATPEAWSQVKISARAVVAGKDVVKSLEGIKSVTLEAKPKLLVTLEPAELTIAPGTTVSAKLKIERNGFEERVAFDIANLPHGVIVDNIGLSGILIPEKQSERQIFLRCDDWVPETSRACFAETKTPRAGALEPELEVLAQEIRDFIVSAVARTGSGHLGSNLGVVELTLALHRVFDSPSDKSVTIPDGTSIGYDKDHDIARGFSVTDSGITVVGKGQVVTP